MKIIKLKLLLHCFLFMQFPWLRKFRGLSVYSGHSNTNKFKQLKEGWQRPTVSGPSVHLNYYQQKVTTSWTLSWMMKTKRFTVRKKLLHQ